LGARNDSIGSQGVGIQTFKFEMLAEQSRNAGGRRDEQYEAWAFVSIHAACRDLPHVGTPRMVLEMRPAWMGLQVRLPPPPNSTSTASKTSVLREQCDAIGYISEYSRPLSEQLQEPGRQVSMEVLLLTFL
jgi:hypothetical protein